MFSRLNINIYDAHHWWSVKCPGAWSIECHQRHHNHLSLHIHTGSSKQLHTIAHTVCYKASAFIIITRGPEGVHRFKEWRPFHTKWRKNRARCPSAWALAKFLIEAACCMVKFYRFVWCCCCCCALKTTNFRLAAGPLKCTIIYFLSSFSQQLALNSRCTRACEFFSSVYAKLCSVHRTRIVQI